MSAISPEGRKWRKGRKKAAPDFCVPFVPCATGQPKKAPVSRRWSRSGGFVDFSEGDRVVTPPPEEKPLLTPVWRGFLRNLKTHAVKIENPPVGGEISQT